MKVDIHSHSSNSDGTWDVPDLLKEAERLGLEYYAVTDHDTLKGSEEALQYSHLFSGKLLLGMEISTKVLGRTTHLLAFFPQISREDIPEIHEVLDKIQNSRYHRMVSMVEKGRRVGLDISIEEVIEEARKDGGSIEIIARPHLARVLVNKGIAEHMDHAFDNWVGEGKPLHAERFTLDYKQWIDLVKKNNGIVVWAHPLYYKDDDIQRLEEAFNELHSAGITGIEIDYPYNKRRAPLNEDFVTEGLNLLKQKAHDHGLLCTTGGDFHGDNGIIGYGEARKEDLQKLESLIYGFNESSRNSQS